MSASASVPATTPPLLVRKSIRCPHCELNQYELASGKCRRCSQWLRLEYAPALSPPVPVSALASTPSPTAPIVININQAVYYPPKSLPHFWLPMVLLLLRLQSGLSQAALARRMGIDRPYVCKVECQGVCPLPSLLPRYVEALGVDMWKVAKMCETLMAKE